MDSHVIKRLDRQAPLGGPASVRGTGPGPGERLRVTGDRRCRCINMTDFMVQIPADWLARVFLSLRRGTSDDAHTLAGELQPFTEKPGQRVPVPRGTVLRTELALRREIETASEEDRRAELSEQAEYLVKARLVESGDDMEPSPLS
ncbi:hypothetical protein GCM10010425_64420 [Streptomyces spororaveus]|uniref:Uncharacterized protein n=2 Tax=Streptomyces TaxID=1883 RepID=A0ABQ3T7G8_9ACTN|nr:hypothetical protein Sspor_16730 [Streptomyces spororaveus]